MSFNDRIIGTALSFDDVLLVPSYSVLKLAEIDVSTEIFGRKLKLPILSAAMDTLTGLEMAEAMWLAGGAGVFHKNQASDQALYMMGLMMDKQATTFGFAVSVNDFYMVEFGLAMSPYSFAVVDTAHADTDSMCLFSRELAKKGFDMNRIVFGNISVADAAVRLINNGVVNLKIGQGSGCLAEGTRILMANGMYKNIEHIKVGDFVINGLGNPDEVVATQFSGIKDCIKYRHDKAIGDTYCTGDHLHKSVATPDINKNVVLNEGYKGIGKKFVKWNRLDSLDKNSLLTLPANINLLPIRSFTIDLNEFSLSNDSNHKEPILYPNYDLGYLIGTFLGDGCACIVKGKRKVKQDTKTSRTSWDTTTNLLRWYLDSKNPAQIGKLSQVFERYGFKYKVKNNVNGKGLTITYVYNAALCRLLSSFGKIDGKHLPEKYWCSDESYLRGLLDGLIDTDGSIDNKKFNLHTTSKSLAELYCYLNLRLYNAMPSVDPQKPTLNKKRPDIVARLPAYRVRFSKSMTTTRLTASGHKILKLKEYCISKKLPTHDIQLRNEPSFIANNCIVHNSICSTRIVAGIGIPQLQAIADISDATRNYEHVRLIADGGLRTSGDIVKALAAGAHAVMLGGMLAGTDESLGGSEYRGMGSLPAMAKGSAARYGQTQTQKHTPEGVEVRVHTKGPVSEILSAIEGGIRAGMGYTGSKNLEELREALFVKITNSGLKESHPHSFKELKDTINYKL